MSVSTFIKENRVLIAGLVLPLLLVGILAVAKSIPASMIPPPEHKIMYYSSGWSSKGQITAKIDANGKLNLVFNKTVNANHVGNDANPTTMIFLYDPKTNTAEETSVTLDKDGKVTPLEKFKDIQLTSQIVASDGYTFEGYRYRGNSLITDIFSYRAYQTGPALTNKGRTIILPAPSKYFGRLEFLGWEK